MYHWFVSGNFTLSIITVSEEGHTNIVSVRIFETDSCTDHGSVLVYFIDNGAYNFIANKQNNTNYSALQEIKRTINELIAKNAILKMSEYESVRSQRASLEMVYMSAVVLIDQLL